MGAALSLVAGWWVVKTSAADAMLRQRPAVAAAIAPNNPGPDLAMALAELDVGAGTVSEAVLRNATAALDDAPLAAEPLLVAGLSAMSAGRTAQGEALLEEARRRNPRLRQARLFLLDRYLRSNRLEQAALELSAIRRLVPGVSEVLAPQLARMIQDERTGASLIRVLRGDPALQQAVLGSLAASGGDPDLIMRIAAAAPPAAATPEGLQWQRQLLSALIERRDFARALGLWRRFGGLPEGAPEKAVHDGRFQRLPGAVPFNWSFYSGSAGIAEVARTPGLDVQYFGREGADLAVQLMVLRPGRYRLRFRAEGSAKGDDSRVAWRVFCGGDSENALLDLPLRDITAAPRAVTGEFTVPQGCGGQWLRLQGVAGEFPGTQTLTIGDVAVVPAGAR